MTQQRLHELIRSGYAGVSKDGRLVDRREAPDATPIQANVMLDTPVPKPVKTQER